MRTFVKKVAEKIATLRWLICCAPKRSTAVAESVNSQKINIDHKKRDSLIWKKVEEYLRLFETYGGNRFSLFLMKRLGKLVSFWARMTLRMKLIAQKELIFLFQMAPSRILWDQ